MATALGQCPFDPDPRQIDLWYTDDQPDEVRFWLHPPGSNENAGWEIRMKTKDLVTLLAAAANE